MKYFISILMVLLSLGLYAQKVHTRYPVSGGLLAGANLYKFNVKDFSGLDYSSKWGFDAGVWVNIPIGHVFSIEPQVMYSGRSFEAKSNASSTAGGKLNFISVPVLLKVGLGKNFALLAGPQFDFLSGYKDDNNVFSKDDWRKSDIGITAGLELFPHSRLSAFARYNWGTKDMFTFDDGNTAIDPKPNYKMNGIHFGLKLRLFGKPVAIVPPAPVVAVVAPVDTDGDGIVDTEDKCPTVPGVARYQGCPIPDTDNDGINDDDDKCPTVAGVAKYQGCPVPDSDKDGINDEDDKCPTVAGLERYQGCPIPDSDNDGVNDEDDKCKNTPGLADNKGCPEMIFYYKRDNANLSAAEKLDLDKLVEWMGRHPELNVSIEGHTSTLGATDYNQKLSEKRAQNTVKYLVSKGVDATRLKAIGHGEKFPVGDNKTEEGRVQSRRVVMRIAE